MNKIDFLERNLSRQLEWVRASETKLSLVLPLSTGMIGALVINIKDFKAWTCFNTAMIGSSIGIATLALIFAALAYFPRTSGPNRSLIYFGCISLIPLKQYQDDVLSIDQNQYAADLAEQCHINARIATQKYKNMRRSMLSLFICMIPWFYSLYILYGDQP